MAEPFQIGQASIGGDQPQPGDVDVFGRPFTRATDEQNERVKKILEILTQTQQNVDPATGQPMLRLPSVAPGEETPTPPSQARSQFHDMLRSDPQRAIEALKGLSQQMQGVPGPAQEQVLQQFGVTPPPVPSENALRAAAAGFQVPGVDPAKAQQMLQQQAQQSEQEFRRHREIQQQGQLAPAGLFLDKQGVPYTPITRGEIEPGTTFYRQNSPQQKVFGATGIINSHVDQTLEMLQGIAQDNRDRISQMLTTRLSFLTNDPKIANLIQFLGPATALAVASAYASGGTDMRGGVRLAEMFQEGVYSVGDTMQTSLTKIKSLTKISLDNAENLNLHPEVIAGIKKRLNTIDKLLEPVGGALVLMRTPNGREMFVPKDKVTRAKELGAVIVEGM